jgi:hypothetical protein
LIAERLAISRFSTPARIKRSILERFRISISSMKAREADQHGQHTIFLDRRLTEHE